MQQLHHEQWDSLPFCRFLGVEGTWDNCSTPERNKGNIGSRKSGGKAERMTYIFGIRGELIINTEPVKELS